MDKRAAVVAAAEEMIRNASGRKSWVELSRVAEGGEPVLFREKFVDWPDLSHEVAIKRMGLGGPRKHEVFIPYGNDNNFEITVTHCWVICRKTHTRKTAKILYLIITGPRI